MNPHTAQYWIETLAMTRHPEGGWFTETYRAAELIPAAGLPSRFEGARVFATAIHFLLERGDVSMLHRIAADEVWHFYAGAPLSVHVIHPDGHYRELLLGGAPEQGGRFQGVVPAGCWFGAETRGEFSLVGCTVAPGFEFADFELGRRADLLGRYSEHEALIRRLTRD